MEYPDGFDKTKLRNKPICGILAVAIAAGVSYPVAYQTLRTVFHEKKLGSRFRGTTWQGQQLAALDRLAVKYRVFQFDKSVMKFCELHQDDGFIYLISIKGHIMTFKNGFIIDQHFCAPWQEYAHPRMKIKRVVKIVGKGW
ncbi:MAG TPA: hypothetical protein VD794_12900 [Flavisolibacter sp.]|nr:hypothetical protein [Flavisolibacter sp.]